jgi:Tol biopolymer transport system component
MMGLEIWLMKSDGTELRLVTKAQAGDWLGAITWAPNGRRLAFIEGKLRPVVAQLALETVNVEDGSVRLVFSNPRMQSTLCWAPDGRILYAEALDENLNDSGIRSIVVDQDTGATRGRSEKLTNGPGLVSSLSISADGRRLSVLRNGIAPQVFVGELGPDLKRLKVRGRLTLDQRPNNPWAWTPDSEAVLFVSRRNGVWSIFKQQIDQNTAELFVGGPDTVSDPRLSPDGTNFFYLLSSKHGDLSSPVKLMRIPTSGGPPQEVLEDSGIADIQCSRFPATLCIFGKPGKGEIAVFSFDPEHGRGRELTRVPDDINWSLSPDGSSLAIVKLFEDQGRIRLISLTGQPSREILVKGGWAAITSLDWLSDSSGLIVAANNSKGTTSLLHVDKQGNAQELLQGHLGWAIPSPDRRYVAFTEFTGENNVWMLENF